MSDDASRLTRALPGAEAVASLLTCPVCVRPLAMCGLRTLGCKGGHRFEAARQGYFNFLTGRGTSFIEDTQEMVAARERVLPAGVYARLSTLLAELAAAHVPRRDTHGAGSAEAPVVLEGGVGTGHYLAGVLAALPDARGIGMDLSRQALRRAAKVPGAVTIAWDLHRRWPLRDASVTVLLDVFAPRNVPEAARVLRPGALALVVTPLPGHLAQLASLGLLGMHPGKAERIEAAFHDTRAFRSEPTLELRETQRVTPALAADLVLMGPAGHHLQLEAVRARAEALAQGATRPSGPDARADEGPGPSLETHADERTPEGGLEVTLAFRIQRFVRLP